MYCPKCGKENDEKAKFCIGCGSYLFTQPSAKQETRNRSLGETSTGIKSNIAGFLSYVLGFFTGIFFYLFEKENKFVRFHAMQSIILSIVLGVLDYIFNSFKIIISVINIAAFILWIVLSVKAYKGERFKFPIIGDIAEKMS